jgi:molybdopterin/thiamine biosynthesis adenylyltransferase
MRSITREYSPRGWLGTPNIVLCDFDIIEEKNLARQNFIRQDISKNKAVVLAERYSKAYGLSITPMITAIEGPADIYQFFKRELNVNLVNEPVMIIMCVDSVVARRKILSNALEIIGHGQQQENVFIIDSGNEDNFGQVNFFNPAVAIHPNEWDSSLVAKLPKLITHVDDITFIPMDVNHYLSLADNPGLGSCADLDQTLAINALVATNIIAVVQNYYYRKPMNFNKVFVDMAGGSSTTFNTMSHFLSVTASVQKVKAHDNFKELTGNSTRGFDHSQTDLVMTMASGIVQKEEVIRIKAEKAAKAAAEKAKAKELADALPITDKIKVVAAEVVETAVVGVKSPSKRSKKIVEDAPPLQVVSRDYQNNEGVVLVAEVNDLSPAIAPALLRVDEVQPAPMHTLQNNVVEPVPAIDW